MKEFKFCMPTKIIFGRGCILNNAELFRQMGTKALIVTGKHSARANGSLADVAAALDKCGIGYSVFDKVEENPTIETVLQMKEQGIKEKVDFVIGIGGGSPIDASKAASCFIKNPDKGVKEFLDLELKTFLPVVAVPTTAGTGTETTPFAVITFHELKTKASPCRNVFPAISFMDAGYMMEMPESVTINTALDILMHLVESYMNKNSFRLQEMLVEDALKLYSECLPNIKSKNFDIETREKLLLSSTMAGMAISNCDTSLPHGMGYMPTYYKGVPHGRSNALFAREYLRLYEGEKKLERVFEILGFKSVDDFGDFIDSVIVNNETYTKEDLKIFTACLFKCRTFMGRAL